MQHIIIYEDAWQAFQRLQYLKRLFLQLSSPLFSAFLIRNCQKSALKEALIIPPLHTLSCLQTTNGFCGRTWRGGAQVVVDSRNLVLQTLQQQHALLVIFPRQAPFFAQLMGFFLVHCYIVP